MLNNISSFLPSGLTSGIQMPDIGIDKVIGSIDIPEFSFQDMLNTGINKVKSGLGSGKAKAIGGLLQGQVNIGSIMTGGAEDVMDDEFRDLSINIGALFGGNLNLNGLIDQKQVDYDIHGGYNRKMKFTPTDILDLISNKFYGIHF